ncbi:MAG TPA: hypothetical protein VH744_05685, partial [Terriglobales bacterium]
MRRIAVLLTFLVCFWLHGQTPPPPPQTARQALLEMFMGAGANAFGKHLPESAQRFSSDDGSGLQIDMLQRISSMGRELASHGDKLETFEDGPMLAVVEEAAGERRLEVVVERDNSQGDGEEIELSVNWYENGQPKPLPVIPRIVFSMKEERRVWRVSEVTVSLRVPLSDPEYLKGLLKNQSGRAESSALANLRTINTAEVTYAATYPERGFTCQLADLGPSDSSEEPAEDHAMLIDPILASGAKGGYLFAISGCDGSPVSSFQVTAVPSESDLDMPAFCADESGVVRYS